jgi:biopolymer transport protein ExbD
MRFPRQAKIFRGPLDAAPAAGLVFLLLIFMQLGSLLYTPGVLVHLNNPAAIIRIAADGRLHFGTNFYTEAETNLLRTALAKSAAGPPFDLRADPDTPPKTAARASNTVNSIFQIQLPGGPRNLIGTDNPIVMVAVNFLGQYIYDNKIVEERELKAGLRERLQEAASESKELTLTIAADEQANWKDVKRLAQWAREAGIKETVLAEWPDKPSVSPAQPPP